MTLEEKLEEAIVKEVHYEVPKNWIWIKFGTVCKLSNGYAFKSTQYKESGIPILRISNIQEFGINFDEKTVYSEYDDKLDRYYVNKGDLLIAMSGATTGKTGVYNENEKAYLNQRVGNIKIEQPQLITEKFRNYIISYKDREILDLAYGGAQPNISTSMVEGLSIPLPPLKEQQRIVDRIESLFEKLDQAKELIEEARDGFEKRKQSLLEKAFRGELTREWRAKNSVDYNETWDMKRFSDVAVIKSYLVDPKEFLEYPHIAPDNIEKKTGKLLEYRTIEQDNVKSAKHRFFSGQIIYSKIRPYLSKVVLVDFEGLCSADMYPIETDLNTRYLYYYMLSSTFVDCASNAGSRSVLPKINQKELGKIKVPICCQEEQIEIVRILDKFLEEESKIEELTQLEDQIELIKKSILAKALRGQLGTNCKEDESAMELLKEILSKE